jgi:outer membrane murein-binding lipoprotein Lpp
MKEKRSVLVMILISIIILLAIILGYGVYTGFKVKAEIISLNNQINQLTIEKQNLKQDYDELKEDYDLLRLDVQKIYQSCINEGPCKGHFPEVSWYCNNVGDEISGSYSASHICVCSSACEMNATEIN